MRFVGHGSHSVLRQIHGWLGPIAPLTHEVVLFGAIAIKDRVKHVIDHLSLIDRIVCRLWRLFLTVAVLLHNLRHCVLMHQLHLRCFLVVILFLQQRLGLVQDRLPVGLLPASRRVVDGQCGLVDVGGCVCLQRLILLFSPGIAVSQG